MYPNLVNNAKLAPELAIIVSEHPVVIFDGVCNFCNDAVNFVINHDPEAKFAFAPSQGETGQALITALGLKAIDNQTLVVVHGSHFWLYSEAVFAIAKALPWPVKAVRVFQCLPKTWCDAAYRLFARHRYRLFGKQNQCMVPTADVKARFLL